MSNSAVESVGAIGSSVKSSSNQLNALHSDAVNQVNSWQNAISDPNAAKKYSCYVLVISVINHLSLDKIDSQVIAESQTMDIEHQLQSEMIKISKFISKIQTESTGTVVYKEDSFCGPAFSPNAYLGLRSDYYQLTAQGAESEDPAAQSVSPDYKKDVDSFVNAFKKMFFCNTDTTAPTVSTLSKITNPNVLQHGKDFDLTRYWSTLNGQYSKYNQEYSTNVKGNPCNEKFDIFGTNASDHASLIQQYVYYKAQLAVQGGSIDNVDAADGDISKLVDFSPTGGDALLSQAMEFITMLKPSESVQLSSNGYTWANTTTDSVLQLILENQRTMYDPSGVSSGSDHWQATAAQDAKVGLYGAFSYMGFNSYWAKATGGTAAQHVAAPTVSAGYSFGNWHEDTGIQGNSPGDDLATSYSAANGVVTTLGTVTGTESVKMQELTSNEGETVNIGQTTLKGMSEAIETYSGNQLSS